MQYSHTTVFPLSSQAGSHGRLQRIGEFLRRKRRWIAGIRWAVVAFYLALVTVPAFLPLPGNSALFTTT